MDDCPCGNGRYAACCGPLHTGTREAETAEELMRSRYSAFVIGDAAYLRRSWDVTTRPAELTLPGVTWTRLRVLGAVAGGADDDHGVVEFRAHFRRLGEPDALHERSTFRRDRDGHWRYLAAE